MKEDKNALYNNKILQCLINGETYTILQLADNVGLSEKTVRTRMKQLDEWLEAEGLGKIEKRRGTGIWLELDGRQKKILESRLEQGEDPAGDFENRNIQLMGKLLKMKPGEVVTLQQLADSLYLSPPTVSNLLKIISEWFEVRNMKITAVRNKGICLIGKEYSFRIAIKDYMLEMLPEVMEALFGTYAPGVDAARIRRIIVEAENAWRIELADNSFKMVWIMTCLSVSRKGLYDGLLSSNMQEENIQRYNEYSFAESIYQRIGREYKVDLSEDDTVLLAVLLLSAKKLKTFTDVSDEDYAMQYDRNLEHFVKLVIETIGDLLEADLSGDQMLYEGLLIHMRSAIFRMKYSTVAGDSISKYVKNEYKQTFLAAWSTSSLFEEYYDVQVTEDELAGIALYIQAAMIRRKKGRPLTALLVSQKGMAACQLSIEMIKYSIPEITDVQAVSRHDFKLSLHPETDIIINGSGLDLEDSRVVTVEDRISEKEIDMIRRKAAQVSRLRNKPDFQFNSLCHQLFEVDLIMVKPQVRDKDQLITMMVKRLEEKGDVTQNYLESVFDRERATTTSIGRGIAIPHGNMAEVNESRIVVAILDKPVKWHEDMVDTIFLLAIKMTSKFEIKRTKQFYKDFLLLTENDDNMEAMKRLESSLEVYQYFIK
ncbi:MAG TPA: transcription antiterminator BglG [Lachnoclostridium sp.]|uniref:BglG family transcription antiterminator n=1 Tax=Lacrimispora sp. TaxID=2719234 RepID=UPI000ECE2B6C|nr:PTS sugar transporter subunit IIA [Lacrimispora sp.]HCD43538.1 transcription antiterminator BglG [Lachnoclostridium sp.]